MIGIINYGAGNTKSVQNALRRLDVESILSSNPTVLLSCEKLLLPGVGHAKHAMKELKSRNLIEVVQSFQKPLLGICLGMQLLCKYSEEGNTKCIGITDDEVLRFTHDMGKVPAMGWNTLRLDVNPLFNEIEEQDYLYFVHSYYVPQSHTTIATSEYGLHYAAALQKDNYYGVQFHPEKSASPGLQILKNFMKL